MKTKTKKDGVSLAAAKKRNLWVVIPIDQLPDDSPVFAVEEFSSKKLAKFFLVEKVLYPVMPKKETE